MQIRGRGKGEAVRFFEVGLNAGPPKLVQPAHDLASVRQGAHYQVTATIWDAPDHRLMRAGVLLAHREVAGQPDWYLSASRWQPWLPIDRSTDGAKENPPAEYRELLRVFIRDSELQPMVELQCTRDVWQVRNGERLRIAELCDERVTVIREGLTTARYREVALRPENASARQLEVIADALLDIGAAPVLNKPPLNDRVGAPANGPSDFPMAVEWADDCDAGTFVRALWAQRLEAIVAADLALRTGAEPSVGCLVSVLRQVRREIRGLAPILESEWVADSDQALAALTTSFAAADVEPAEALLSPGYLAVVNRLVAAIRFPRVLEATVSREMKLVDLIRALAENALDDARSAVDELSAGAPQKVWDTAVGQVEGLVDVCAITDLLPSTRNRRLTKRAVRLAGRLTETTNPQLKQIKSGVAQLSAQEAFAAGRRYEILRKAQSVARAEVLAQWSAWRRKLVLS